MATICATPFKVPRIRVTELDECGTPVEGDCSTVVSDGIMTVEISREYEDREDFYKKNADGVFCVKVTEPPILKWINLTVTMCNVNPQMVRILAGETLLEDDATPPNIIGFTSTESASSLANAAFEMWTRTTGSSNCGVGVTRYGYVLLPWVIEGTVGDLTFENGTADFVYTGRTQAGGDWGVGPYNVVQSAAVATLGDPLPLFDPVTDEDHEIWLWTTLAPPTASCDCIALPLPLVAVDSGVLTATVTLPVGVLPAFIDWGDGMTETVTVGPSAMHVYAGAGSKTISVWPQNQSSAAYTTTVAIA